MAGDYGIPTALSWGVLTEIFIGTSKGNVLSYELRMNMILYKVGYKADSFVKVESITDGVFFDDGAKYVYEY